MNYFIYGTTDLAENLFYLLSEDGIEITAFVVERKYISDEYKTISLKNECRRLQVIPFEELETNYKKKRLPLPVYRLYGYEPRPQGKIYGDKKARLSHRELYT